MKIPSIIKIPRHQRFHIEPRYYDPVKEEIEQREKLIIAEINAEKKKGTYVPGTRIASSFKRRSVQKDNSGLLRFLIAAMLFTGTFVYLLAGYTALLKTGQFILYFALGAWVFSFLYKNLKKGR